MISLVVRAILVLGILEAVDADPKHVVLVSPVAVDLQQGDPIIIVAPVHGSRSLFATTHLSPFTQNGKAFYAATTILSPHHVYHQPGFTSITVNPIDGYWNEPEHVEQKTQPAISGAAVKGSSAESGATPTIASRTSSERLPQCLNPPDPGECRGAFPRYYYNSTLDQCDCFLYGGCDNEGLILSSSWLTLTECTDKCRPSNTEEGEMCKLLPKDLGQNSTQANIAETSDTSHLSDHDLLDTLLG